MIPLKVKFVARIAELSTSVSVMLCLPLADALFYHQGFPPRTGYPPVMCHAQTTFSFNDSSSPHQPKVAD